MEDGLISDASYWYGRVSEFSSSDWKVVCYQIIFHQINLIFIWLSDHLLHFQISDIRPEDYLNTFIHLVSDIRPEDYLNTLIHLISDLKSSTSANIWYQTGRLSEYFKILISDLKDCMDFNLFYNRPNIWYFDRQTDRHLGL